MIRQASIAAALTVALSGLAVAQTSLLDASTLFRMADTNRDGVVTRAEFRAERVRSFARIDSNTDGGITLHELSAVAGGFRERAGASIGFGRLDADGDGRVTRDELNRAPTPGFDRADADRDGNVNAAELQRARR